MALNAQITLSAIVQETTDADISRTMRATPVNYAVTFSDGTGANQAQVAWSDARTVAAGADDQMHTSAGFAGFADDRGAVGFTAIKFVYIKNAGSVDLQWSGNEWSGGPVGQNVILKPGSALTLAAPDAAGWATAGGYMMVSNIGASSGSYDILLIGEGAVT